ncbi:MAG: TolC family protein, partial [Planctomycetota bacterium]|nr:TolC family protein [Planctomycetota bacterium]
GIPPNEVGLGRSENKIAIVQTLILGGRRSAAISAATAERDARSLLVQSKLREVQSELQRIHVDLVYLRQAIVLHLELGDVAQETLRVARTRFDAKAAPESEVIKAQIDVYELGLSRRRLDRLLTALSEQLTSLLGGVRVPVETIGGRLPRKLPELDIHRLQVAVRERHPAVLAAEKNVEVADCKIDEAKAERISDIGVRLAYGRDAATGEDSVEAGISIPLLLFNRNQGRILESRHLASKAKRDAESLVDNLLSELAISHASYTTARDEVETLHRQIVPAAERAFQQAKEGYQAGKIGFLDLLDAQRTLTRGQLSLLESVKDMNVARAKLWKIVGREIEE